MEDQNKAQAYFRSIILGYNKNDIEFLLDRIDEANFPTGSLLLSVMSGIDTCAALLEDWLPSNVGTRIKSFIVRMGCTEEEADYIYKVCRNGMVHEAVCKKGGIGAYKDNDGIFFENNDILTLNVYKLAKVYLNEIQKINMRISEIKFIQNAQNSLPSLSGYSECRSQPCTTTPTPETQYGESSSSPNL